jgi:magnesium transporter
MLTAHPPTSDLSGAFWIDLFRPDAEERNQVEQHCKVHLPSQADLTEIESSSRHYLAEGRLFLSTPILTRDAEGMDFGLTPLGFILDKERLITQRFGHANLFGRMGESLDKCSGLDGPESYCLIVEALVDQLADLLEAAGSEIEHLSHATFARSGRKAANRAATDALAAESLKAILGEVGHLGDRIGHIRSSLLGLGRLIPFVSESGRDWLSADQQGRLTVARQDLVSLADYEGHLANKVQFLLDAVLGFISIEQNDVVKILTIVSIVGVPPVLIAGVYGMNFKFMPELDWRLGYPFALGLMLATTIIPLIWFRWKKWF